MGKQQKFWETHPVLKNFVISVAAGLVSSLILDIARILFEVWKASRM